MRSRRRTSASRPRELRSTLRRMRSDPVSASTRRRRSRPARPPQAFFQSLASDGHDVLGAWQTTVASANVILGARVSGGAATAPFTIAAGNGSHGGPALAWNGSNYLVAWTTTSGGRTYVEA